MRHTLIIVGSVLLIPAVAAAHYAAGVDLSIFVFYYIPVALLAWHMGRASALIAATLCAVLWYVVDQASGHVYGHPAMGVWNALLRWISFAVVAVALARIRDNQKQEAELNRRLAGANAELQESLAKIAALRNDVQLVCAWTNRIKSEGHWIKFEEFMARHFQLRFTHGISEEGMRQLREEEEQARAEAERRKSAEASGSEADKG